MRSLFKRNLLEIKIKVAGDGDPQGQRRTIFQDQSKAQAKWGEGGRGKKTVSGPAGGQHCRFP